MSFWVILAAHWSAHSIPVKPSYVRIHLWIDGCHDVQPDIGLPTAVSTWRHQLAGVVFATLPYTFVPCGKNT